jgi:protein TonB
LNLSKLDLPHAQRSLLSMGREVLADRVLSLCTLLALLLHALFIFGLSFVAPGGDRALMQDVTVAVTPSQQKTPQADFLAQADQAGSGVLRQAQRLTSPEQAQQAAERVQASNPQVNQTATAHAPTQHKQQRVLVTTLSWREQPQSDVVQETQQRQVSPSPEAAQAAVMVATLEAQYAKRKQEYTKKTKVHTVDSVATKADPSAHYLDGFRRKVERTGNRHYPDAARAARLHGDVRLMVILQPDGAVRAIRLLESSGHAVLDEAAKASVRQAAPYARFDAAMSAFSELRIIRTWRFSDQMNDLAVDP